ncbi:MAG TPA: hypothetical protein VHE59_15710 [Mucilaginibacter sp.]|nr:hypothetical protein [Mucilaginibacter sp.]
MKGRYLLLLLFIAPVISSAQLNNRDEPFNVMMVGVGMQETFITNAAFDAWTQLYHHRMISSRPAFGGELDYIYKRFDIGGHLTVPYPYGVAGAYIGTRVTRRRSPLAMFLNFEAGGFYGHYKNIPPLYYMPTSDQAGQDLYLRYTALYIGLSTRTYFNRLHFRIGSRKKGISVNSGLFVTGGYMPFGRRWEYGYDTIEYNADENGSSTVFNGVKISTIPYMSRFFVNAGLIVAVGI